MKRRIFCLLLIVILLIIAAGCGNNPVDTSETSDTSATIETDDSTADTQLPFLGDYVHPLTGLPCYIDYSGIRPVAFMINNWRPALPQSGVSKADIIYEAEAEGGITRLVAVFQDITDVGQIGTIRSTRPVFINIAQNHDAILVHCGGSPQAYDQLAKYKFNKIDGISDGHDTFWRDPVRRKSAGYEHALYTFDDRVTTEINRQKMRMTVDTTRPAAYGFATEPYTPADGQAAKVTLKYGSYKPYFTYDEQTGEYLRYTYDAPHIDEAADGVQLSFKNVIVLNVPSSEIKGDKEGRRNFSDIGTGTGIYVTNGRYVMIKWTKPSMTAPLQLTTLGNEQLKINPGRIFIAFVNGTSNWVTE